MPTLNYRYAIFPTRPQAQHLCQQMRRCRLQWDRATAIRRQLKGSLLSCRVKVLLNILLSSPKNDTNSNRAAAIQRRAEQDHIPLDQAGRWYDLRNIFGTAFQLKELHLDLAVLAEEVELILRDELRVWHEWWHIQGVRPQPAPKRRLYFSLLRACGNHAGRAKSWLDDSFPATVGAPSSVIRFSISGSSTNGNFERACNPSPDQRQLGNRGEPNFKRRVEAYGYQELLPIFSECPGKIRLRGLPHGMEWVLFNQHRPLPASAKIKRLTVQQAADRWYVVLTIDVDEADYTLIPHKPAWEAGCDTGSITALTVAMQQIITGEVSYKKFDWRPLSASLSRLQKISQRLSKMQGPDRRKGQVASKRWVKENLRRKCLYARIANQRRDILHKISRWLADYRFVAIGEWEQLREVEGRKAYRKKLAGKVEPGEYGIREKRREGRDLSLATLRRLVEEKVTRAGGESVVWAAEHYTTQVCSTCNQQTGPTDTKIRNWLCSHCHSQHDVDENAALNILRWSVDLHRKEEEEKAHAAIG